VSDTGPLARSPIPVAEPAGHAHGWHVSARRSSAGLRLADHTASAKVVVRAHPRGVMAERVGVGVGRAARTGGRHLICGYAPGEWLAIATLDRRAALWAHLEALAGGAEDLRGAWFDETHGGPKARKLASLVDVTHGRVLLRLTGAHAADALSRICGVDLHDDVTPGGAALRTSVAALVTEIVRDDVRGERSYLLGCEWSSGEYLWDSVMRAGAEFGIDADGARDL